MIAFDVSPVAMFFDAITELCKLVTSDILCFPLSNDNWVKTQCQDEFRIPSGRTQKLKVAKWCWKQRNEHNLMYIYQKQCENMQKKSMKVLKRPNSVFLQGDVRSSVLKTQKTRKTRETKS